MRGSGVGHAGASSDREIVSGSALKSVGQWQEGQEDVALLDRQTLKDRFDVGHDIAVGQHDTLRPPRRTQRVYDGGKVVRLDRDIISVRGRGRTGGAWMIGLHQPFKTARPLGSVTGAARPSLA